MSNQNASNVTDKSLVLANANVNPYQPKSCVAEMFALATRPNGATMAELNKLSARHGDPSTAFMPLTKHVRGLDGAKIGKHGFVWGVRINGGNVQFGSVSLPSDNSARVEIVGVRPISDVERLRTYNNGYRNGSQRVPDVTDYALDGKRIKTDADATPVTTTHVMRNETVTADADGVVITETPNKPTLAIAAPTGNRAARRAKNAKS